MQQGGCLSENSLESLEMHKPNPSRYANHDDREQKIIMPRAALICHLDVEIVIISLSKSLPRCTVEYNFVTYLSISKNGDVEFC